MTVRLSFLARTILLFAAAVLSACSLSKIRPDPPRMSLAGLELKQIDLFEQRYLLTLRLQNLNDRKISVRGMDYELFLNGQSFAHGVSKQSVTVPAFGEEMVQLEVVSTLMNIFRQWGTVGESEEISYRFVGNVKLNLWPAKIPFEYTGEIAVPYAQPLLTTQIRYRFSSPQPLLELQRPAA